MANSTPRAQSLTMPEDQPRGSTSADAATQRALLAAQHRTNELLARQEKRAGFSWLRVFALLAVIGIIVIFIL